MSAYLSAVLADTPRHYWRCADPGGFLLHDIGSVPIPMEFQSWNCQLPYLGPVTDGGAIYLAQSGPPRTNQQQDSVAVPVTLECWFWPWSIGFINAVIMSAWGSSGTSLVSARISSGTSLQVFTPGGNLALGTVVFDAWNHLAVVVQAAGATVYLNGVNIGGVAGGAYASQPTSFAVGADSNNLSGFMHAAFAEFAVYTSALSGARVTAHFNAADATTQRPVFHANGTFNITSGVAQVNNELLQQILAAVRQTYTTTH